jgi:2-keto-4-pentenoate hydratase/2-oxohepta-3-ene-1,7-dioic acid hydratase in catechol pathway
MKLVTVKTNGGLPKPGLMLGTDVIDLNAAAPDLPCSLREILAQGLMGKVAEVAGHPRAVRFKDFEILAPIPDPKKIIGIGLNYRNHAVESGMAIPDEPVATIEKLGVLRNPCIAARVGTPAIS